MRIAHFIHRYPPALGGAESYFARLGRFHKSHGDQVTVFTTVADDLKSFWSPNGDCFPPGDSQIDGIAVRRYPLWRMHGRRWLLKPLSMIPNARIQALTLPCNPIAPAMWRDAGSSRQQFDAVHATAFPYLFPIACGLRMARRLGVPFFLTPFLHLGDPDNPHDHVRYAYTAPAMRAILREADAVFVQSPTEREAAASLGVARERIVLQGLGVDTNECTGGNRDRARIAWGTNSQTFVIGHLANLSEEKGTVDLLRAIELMPKDLDVLVVLAGPRMPNFDRFWQDHSPQHPVKILGRISDEEKCDFLAGIDVLSLPSRCDSFGLVIPEAWANGKPVIAYRAGGVADLVKDQGDGFLVQCGDISAFGQRLSECASNAELCRRLGMQGQQRTIHELKWNDKLNVVRDVLIHRTRRALSA